MNLVQMVMGYLLKGGTLAKISSMLGIGQDSAREATQAAVPAMLAGLSQVASTPDGARRLDAAIESADEHAADDPVAALSRSGDTNAASSLQSLFGGGTWSAIAGAIGKFTGLNASSITSMLGAIGPMLLGLLKSAKKSSGMDIGRLLADQKSNIASALPAGLASQLSGVPGLPDLSQWTGSTRSSVENTYQRGKEAVAGAGREVYGQARDATAGVSDAAHATAHQAGGLARWALPALLALLAIGLLWWAFLGKEKPEQVQVNTTDRNLSAQRNGNNRLIEPDAIVAGGVIDESITTQVKEIFSKAGEAITSIRDVSSAEAAVPKLNALTESLDKAQPAIQSLTGDSRTKMMALLRESRATLQSAVDKAKLIPGVGEKLQPPVDALMKKTL